FARSHRRSRSCISVACSRRAASTRSCPTRAWPRSTWARAMANEALLKVAGLRAGYGPTPILQGIDLEIGQGEIVSLIGRNGVGKTTTLRCLMGQLAASAGSIVLRGRDITRLQPDARARAGIGFVPQGREVFPKLTVEEN